MTLLLRAAVAAPEPTATEQAGPAAGDNAAAQEHVRALGERVAYLEARSELELQSVKVS